MTDNEHAEELDRYTKAIEIAVEQSEKRSAHSANLVERFKAAQEWMTPETLKEILG